MLDDLILRLGREFESRENGYGQGVDDILAQITRLNDPTCIRRLLP
jgi:hypothetical protein